MSDDSSTVRTRFEQAVEALVDANPDIDAGELASQVPLAIAGFEDEYADWHYSSSFEGMVRAHFYRLLIDESHSELARRLAHDADLRQRLGVKKPWSRSTYSRVWNDRFGEEFCNHLERRREFALEILHEHGHPLSARIEVPDAPPDASQQTEDQRMREGAKEAAELAADLAYPAFGFELSEQATYDDRDLLEVQTAAGFGGEVGIEQGSELFGDQVAREQEDQDEQDVATGETCRSYLKDFTVQEYLDQIDEGMSGVMREVCKHIEFNRPPMVGIDTVEIPYHGESKDDLVITGQELGMPDRFDADEEVPLVKEVPKEADEDHDYYIEMATVTIVGDNPKFVLAYTPVWRGRSMGDIVRELIWRAKNHVNIMRVFADRAFYAADVFLSLQEAGVDYVIPAPRTSRVKNFIRRTDRSRYDVRVKEEGLTHEGISDDYVYTNLVGVPKQGNEDETAVFATNMDLKDETRLDREDTKQVINGYSRRAGMESVYSKLNEFRPWTSSKEYIIRFCNFGFATILHTLWLLVDFLLKKALDREWRTKPRFKAKRFGRIATAHLAAIT